MEAISSFSVKRCRGWRTRGDRSGEYGWYEMDHSGLGDKEGEMEEWGSG